MALLAVVVCALGAAPAQAALVYESSFGSGGNGAAQFSAPSGIAVDEATGDLYVADPALNRIQRFTAAGGFIGMWGKGVNQTTGGDICTAASGDTCGPGAVGDGPGQFSSPAGIAVDNAPGSAGAVYVQDNGNNRVQKFGPAGDFLLTWGKGVNQTTGGDICTALSGDLCAKGGISGSGGFNGHPVETSAPGEFAGWTGNVAQLGVDGTGFVYVGDSSAGPKPRVQKFDSDGHFVSQLSGEQGNALGLNEFDALTVNAAGDVFVVDRTNLTVKRFSADDFGKTGPLTYLSAFDRLGLGVGRPRSLAVDPSNRFLFVSDSTTADCALGPPSQRIVEFHPSGQRVDCSAPIAPPIGVSGLGGMVISANHRLYATDIADKVVRTYVTPVASAPAVSAEAASEITSTSARVDAEVAANLDDTTFHIEYGTSPCSLDACAQTDESQSVGAMFAPVGVHRQLTGLTPETTYYYRVVVTSKTGTLAGADHSFTTFAPPLSEPSCPNSLARQQTKAGLLLDCRAYELVSAADTGGYNVESSLVSGQAPYGGFPGAPGRALYAIHNGGIPNTGKPTNRGPDPYLAIRDATDQRWNTAYVGIPADAPSAAPFSSTLGAADDGLRTFAFAGPELCNPCFGDGSKGIPVRLPDGSLVQGMAGSLNPAAAPAGSVRKPLSADGEHLVFGSTGQYESDANSNGTDATIYERDLTTSTTQVVSKLPDGSTIQSGSGVAELAISTDGSRVLVGRLISTDASGNEYFHLYMHVDGASQTVDVTPGATAGVLYDGMTADGSRVYFTAKDALATASDQDTDSSADIYAADLAAGAATLSRISTGAGSGDTDACDPAANSAFAHWNSPSPTPSCDAVAIGGAGGVSAADGSIYFLSPELLDTSSPGHLPIQDAPNLYLARPGSAPRFVATLESSLSGSQPPARIYGFKQNFGAFGRAVGVAVEHSSGDVYVLDVGTGSNNGVKKFDAAGNPVKFTAGSGAGTNKVNGADAPSGVFSQDLLAGLPAEIAVDQASGNFYVPDFKHDVVDVFAPSGEYLSQISAASPAGVAVNPTSGNVYVTSNGGSSVGVFTPSGTALTSFPVIAKPSGVAVDSSGRTYVVNGSRTAAYDASGKFVETIDANPSFGVAVDTASEDVFVDEGDRFTQFDASGGPAAPGPEGDGDPVGAGSLSNSTGIAVDSGRVYASNQNGKSVAAFGLFLKPGPAIDSPLVIDSVRSSGTRHSADFQVTPSGEEAVFSSTLPLTGFDSASSSEVFRYDAGADALACVSCSPIGGRPSSDARLAPDGLSLTDDGRVFFDTGERLVQRDTNSRRDAYEWSSGRTELISTGTSSSDSALLSATSDGTDAFFFTRQTLVSSDLNGSLTKLYDAREGGGFLVSPTTPSCASSDECHGPGAPAPGPPSISPGAPSGGNVRPAPRCRKGRVTRHRRCPKIRRHTKHRRRSAER